MRVKAHTCNPQPRGGPCRHCGREWGEAQEPWAYHLWNWNPANEDSCLWCEQEMNTKRIIGSK